jgi:hypothetical protein
MVTRLAWIAARLVSSNWGRQPWSQSKRYACTHERHEVRLGSLLEGHDGRRLEAEVGLEVLGDLTNETLEGEFADEELGGPAGVRRRPNKPPERAQDRLVASLTSGIDGSHGERRYRACIGEAS